MYLLSHCVMRDNVQSVIIIAKYSAIITDWLYTISHALLLEVFVGIKMPLTSCFSSRWAKRAESALILSSDFLSCLWSSLRRQSFSSVPRWHLSRRGVALSRKIRHTPIIFNIVSWSIIKKALSLDRGQLQ